MWIYDNDRKLLSGRITIDNLTEKIMTAGDVAVVQVNRKILASQGALLFHGACAYARTFHTSTLCRSVAATMREAHGLPLESHS